MRKCKFVNQLQIDWMLLTMVAISILFSVSSTAEQKSAQILLNPLPHNNGVTVQMRKDLEYVLDFYEKCLILNETVRVRPLIGVWPTIPNNNVKAVCWPKYWQDEWGPWTFVGKSKFENEYSGMMDAFPEDTFIWEGSEYATSYDRLPQIVPYPAALYEQFQSNNVSKDHVIVAINDEINWVFGGAKPVSKIDHHWFRQVMFHEIAHGLGFTKKDTSILDPFMTKCSSTIDNGATITPLYDLQMIAGGYQALIRSGTPLYFSGLYVNPLYYARSASGIPVTGRFNGTSGNRYSDTGAIKFALETSTPLFPFAESYNPFSSYLIDKETGQQYEFTFSQTHYDSAVFVEKSINALMNPQQVPANKYANVNYGYQEIDLETICALWDRGWGSPVLVFLREVFSDSFGVAHLDSSKQLSQTNMMLPYMGFSVINTKEPTINIVDCNIIGKDSIDFTLVGSVNGELLEMTDSRRIKVFFTPQTEGFKFAYIELVYEIEGTQSRRFLPFTGLALNLLNDLNLNGIHDANEPALFSCGSDDCTGDEGNWGPDGIPDGFNDWDGDGVSNQDEVILGSDLQDSDDVAAPHMNDGISQPVTLTNTLNWPIEVNGAKIMGDDAENYFLSSDDDFVLFSQESRNIYIAFHPLTVGPKDDAYLRIYYYDGIGDKTIDVSLIGAGVSFP